MEPPIKDTPNKGHLSIRDTCFNPVLILPCIIEPPNKGHLCIKDTFHGPSVSFIQRFHCIGLVLPVGIVVCREHPSHII